MVVGKNCLMGLLAIASFFGVVRSEPVRAVELENPPAFYCTIDKKTEPVQRKLVRLDLVLYNWKSQQSDIIRLLNDFSNKRISSQQFDQRMRSAIARLKQLTDMVDTEAEQLEELGRGKDDSLTSLSEAIIDQKAAGLTYLQVAMGSEAVSPEDAREQYDSTWANFVQLWNMTNSSYRCGSTNPWAQF